jgi:tetratricopeptide (TPR) repeat protein/transglutaminase-like putative cysteine protease
MRLGLTCSILLLCILAIPCGAQTSPAEPSSGGADVSKEAWVVERSITTITVEDSGRDVREVTAEVKLLADAGVKQFAVLNFRYISANETVELDYVRVRKQDGTVVKTPDYNIQDMPADITRTAPLYSDIHEKHVAVKGLGVGDVLEYRVRYKTHTPQMPGQAWYECNLSKDQIVREERLEISVPATKHFVVKSPAYPPEVVEQGSTRTYKWKHSNLQRKEEQQEETASKRSTPPPDIQVSTFASWEEIGRWYSELQKEQIAVTPAIAKKAEELTKGLTTDDEKIRALYSFVALHIHYIGLDFGIGRYKPHAAEEVLDNEYGDCKDKHTLLAALLKAAGIEAWPVLIHASQKLDVDVPSPAQFNHVITVVPRGNELVWLDTTTEVAPFGLLLYPLRDKEALVIPAGKAARLQTTPANPPFPQEQTFKAVAKLGADGVLKGHITQRYRGDTEVLLRAGLRQIPESKWKEGIQGLSRAAGFGGEVSNVSISSLEDLQKPLEISYDYERKDYSDWEHKQILALLPPMGIEAASFKEKPSKEPVFLGAPGEIVYTSEIELPPGSSVKPPKNLDLDEPYAEYHTQNLLEGGKLKTKRRLVIKKSEVTVAEWESYKKMAKAASDEAFTYLPLSGLADAKSSSLQNVDDLDAKFKEASEALQARDVQRAKELLDEVIAAEPKYVGAHYNLAVAWAGMGRMNEAIEEYQKEEEVDPENSRSYQMAAFLAALLRQNDVAISELRKLLKVDPKNREGATRLADLLSQEGKNDEAATVLEAAVKLSPTSSSLHMALADAYVQAGQKEKAVPHFRTAAEAVEKSSPIDYMQLNNLAYSMADAGVELDLAKHCIEKALEEVDRRSSATTNDGQSRLTLTRTYSFLWDSAGWVYLKAGDLPRAESYVRASWLLSQQGIVGEHLGEIYEKLGKTKEAAHAYELAYAAMGASSPPMIVGPVSGRVTGANQDAQEQAKAHYQKLTGKPINIRSMDRLPNGKWPVSPEVELSEMREAKLGPEPGPNDSADFELKFAAGEPTVATYLSGNAEMKSMKKRLEAAKFKVEIPVGSKAIIYRRATVHCSKWSPCSAVLAPIDPMGAVSAPTIRIE